MEEIGVGETGGGCVVVDVTMGGGGLGHGRGVNR